MCSIEAQMKRPSWDLGRDQDPVHLVVAEDVRQEDRFLDRRQRVLWHVAQRITAPAIEAQLAHDAELVGDRHCLAAGDAAAPSCYRVVERHLTMIAPVLCEQSARSSLRTNSARQ